MSEFDYTLTKSKQNRGCRKSINGVGINDSSYPIMQVVNGKKTLCPYYRAWKSMFQRCYDTKFHKRRPNYIGCSVSPIWHKFTTFRAWMIEQDWEGNYLDKDIIVSGNKIYSPDTCVFVSKQINTLLNSMVSCRGKYPQGVTWDINAKKFASQLRKHGKQTGLGYFDTVEEAETAYKLAKTQHIRVIANTQTDKRLIDALLRHANELTNNS